MSSNCGVMKGLGGVNSRDFEIWFGIDEKKFCTLSVKEKLLYSRIREKAVMALIHIFGRKEPVDSWFFADVIKTLVSLDYVIENFDKDTCAFENDVAIGSHYAYYDRDNNMQCLLKACIADVERTYVLCDWFM